jgi:hypothetical protein
MPGPNLGILHLLCPCFTQLSYFEEEEDRLSICVAEQHNFRCAGAVTRDGFSSGSNPYMSHTKGLQN